MSIQTYSIEMLAHAVSNETLTGPAGMPPLVMGDKPLSMFEFWSGWLFYTPVLIVTSLVMVRFRSITLPTITNPGFSVGGFVGESKNQILLHARNYIGDKIAPFVLYRHRINNNAAAVKNAQDILREANLDFPIVAKPDISCRGAGVQPLYTLADLQRYISQISIDADIILQKMVSAEGEAGIFYVREPQQRKGRILSITLKYFPYVVGDGKRTLQQLIEADARASALTRIYFPRFAEKLLGIPAAGERVRLAFAGNHSKGTIFRNGNDLITPEMTDLFDRLSQAIPGFYFGRYDIRFNDFRRIRDGHDDFTILEINGSGAEATHIWDARTTLFSAWRDVLGQLFLAWKIGAINRKNGSVSLSLWQLIKLLFHEKRLIAHYPPTF